ncbi:hydrogenase iron-sulfur subunit [Desulfobacula sp.]|uniref:hydrogenase iron-sulfur subunit n=1 Tax=Desulfobacula sp. TaxID=2593537 RepID=UPI0025BBB5CF|nr:hydrogenase iron-sulfur subunit [Desulfobacula sp.]MBC2703356.1 hydrogenase iron-sulfur subunit [Desulfobacula sp.]
MENKIKEFKHLEKWQGTLANCIRCGYCFEHCPMFHHTGWESDAPRAKIITAFGLLEGEIEPSEAAADKMFSCFYCKRCEAACSSGVPLTEIFTDAKKDLVEMGLKGPGTTSITELYCARCLLCVGACPHEARFYDGKGIATDPAKCQACGICIEVCPAGAAKIENHFGTAKDDLIERASTFLTTHESSKAIIFACNWSYYPELQASVLPESETREKAYEILVNMCGGRLEAHLLMAPFLHNAWGVMAAVCPDGECQHDGNLRAKKIVESLHNTFKSIDINPERVRLVQIPAGDKTLFQAEIDTFMDKLNKMGPIR